jgi:hypothetical protein
MLFNPTPVTAQTSAPLPPAFPVTRPVSSGLIQPNSSTHGMALTSSFETKLS